VIAAGLDAPAVTWAPTTLERRRARGFDPAEVLARAVARGLGVPCARLLDRRPGPPQTGLAAAARLLGPRFVARRAAPSRVLLVDDVATTGATLAAAAAALRGAGAQNVLAITGARTPPPRMRRDTSVRILDANGHRGSREEPDGADPATGHHA
jgi:predicted amidophosphoribosyltransferase